MNELPKTTDYTIISELSSNKLLEVLIAFKEQNTEENLYILNKFKYCDENLEIFKDFFSYFSGENKPKDYLDFFVYEKYFYIVFKYVKGECIVQKYSKELNTTKYEDRCAILDQILIKIDSLHHMPVNGLLCITDPKNIRIDKEKNVRMVYDLTKIFDYQNMNKTENKYQNTKRRLFFKNLHDIIFTMLKPEAAPMYNTALRVVLGKTENAVYKGIPQLAVELRRAEEVSKSSTWWTFIKYQYSLRKPLVNRIIRFATTSAVVAGLIWLGYASIMNGTKPSASAAVVTIGNTVYNAGTEDESSKELEAERPRQTAKVVDMSQVSLHEGIDIEYEDHIVQAGETIISICEEHYKNASYANLVATFNSREIKENLTPGSILRLPNRTAVALYIAS